MLAAERELAAGDDDAGVRLGEAIGTWSDLGGYELEGQWDAACRRIARAALDEAGDRPAETLSGGERKRLVLELLLTSDAPVLLLDEPDNFLDIPAKRWLEEQIRATQQDPAADQPRPRAADAAARHDPHARGLGAWVHGGSYATYPEAPRRSPGADGRPPRALERGGAAPARARADLQGARAVLRDWAKRADAAETRWKRFVDDGPPPAPVATSRSARACAAATPRGACSSCDDVAIDGLSARSPTRSTSASASG